MSQNVEIVSNIHPNFLGLNVRHNGPQQSICVRSFSPITKYAGELSHLQSIGLWRLLGNAPSSASVSSSYLSLVLFSLVCLLLQTRRGAVGPVLVPLEVCVP